MKVAVKLFVQWSLVNFCKDFIRALSLIELDLSGLTGRVKVLKGIMKFGMTMICPWICL